MRQHAGPVPGRCFRPASVRPDATARLFLFPHGGAAAASYGHWSALVPADVELLLVQLPGRHDRRAEQSFTQVAPAVAALREALDAELDDRPYAFVGHSMGAMLAYRLTVTLQRDGGPRPVLLGVSSWAPEGYRDGARELARMSDSELADTARQLGALPAAIAADPQMLSVVLPTLRADLAVFADHVDDGATVSCPVAAYGGQSDPLLLPGAMATWATRSPDFLGVSEYPGGHFYLDEHAVGVAADLDRHLRRLLAG